MSKITTYIEFLSKWLVIYTVDALEHPFGSEPNNSGDVFEEIDWKCQTINGYSLNAFSHKLQEFDNEILKFEKAIKLEPITIPQGYSIFEIILAKENATILKNKIESIRVKKPNPLQTEMECIWRFKGDDILSIGQVYFDDYEIQHSGRWDNLLNFSEEFLTLFIYPLYADLEKLIPTLSVLIATSANAPYSLPASTSEKNNESKKMSKKDNLNGGQLIFQSDFFSNNSVVSTLKDFLVGEGKFISIESSGDFSKIFSNSKTIGLVAKLSWEKSKSQLRYFLKELSKIFELDKSDNEMYQIAECCFLVKGTAIPFTTTFPNGHNTSSKASQIKIDGILAMAKEQFSAKSKKIK
ncbi:MAG: hypothetical protein IPI46_07915 [Bacteroidetes bacterium]|nr:hypothetical protein [Bacteroidota bacterium]